MESRVVQCEHLQNSRFSNPKMLFQIFRHIIDFSAVSIFISSCSFSEGSTHRILLHLTAEIYVSCMEQCCCVDKAVFISLNHCGKAASPALINTARMLLLEESHALSTKRPRRDKAHEWGMQSKQLKRKAITSCAECLKTK